MIIDFAGPGAEAARESIAAVTAGWSHPADTTASTATVAGSDAKGIDPAAVTSSLLSVPSAVLAVADIADRIRKRRRAGELIERARQMSHRADDGTARPRGPLRRPRHPHPRPAPGPRRRRTPGRLNSGSRPPPGPRPALQPGGRTPAPLMGRSSAEAHRKGAVPGYPGVYRPLPAMNPIG